MKYCHAREQFTGDEVKKAVTERSGRQPERREFTVTRALEERAKRTTERAI